MAGVLYCPHCGHEASGGLYVCGRCGKVFCSYCDSEGKNPYPGNTCPRCGSSDWKHVSDWNDIMNYLKNSIN